MFNFIKKNSGLTLIEIIISITILMIIIIPISSLFVTSAKINVSSKDLLTANQLAQKHMEHRRNNPSIGEINYEGGLVETKVESVNLGSASDPIDIYKITVVVKNKTGGKVLTKLVSYKAIN